MIILKPAKTASVVRVALNTFPRGNCIFPNPFDSERSEKD